VKNKLKIHKLNLLFFPRPRKALSISGEPGVVEFALVICAGIALMTVAFN